MSNSSFQLGLPLGTSGATTGTYGNGSSMSQLTVNAQGQITVASNQSITSVNGGPISGFRNQVINGNMSIWQRGTSFSFGTFNTSYTADRWGAIPYVGVMNVSQNTSAPSGFQYSLTFGRPSGNSTAGRLVVVQGIETVNAISLQGQPITLSFWAKSGANFSSAGSSLHATIFTGTGIDQSVFTGVTSGYSGNIAPVNFVPALSTSWQKFTAIGTCGSNISEMLIQFWYDSTGTAGADENVYVTGVQIEIGNSATPFENRSFVQELSLSQRYFNKSFNYNTTPANAIGTNTGESMWDYSNGTNNSVTRTYLPWGVPMRTTPSIIFYNPVSNNSQARQYNSPADCSSTGTAEISDRGVVIITTAPSPTSLGNQLGVHWTASAEL